MRLHRSVIALVAAAVATGCGGDDDDYANNPRPASPVNVAAVITDDKVSVSPREVGAGPVVLIVANQSSAAQRVSLETDELGGDQPGIRTPKTSPINPRGTAELKVDLRKGTYRLMVEGSGDALEPVRIEVGEARESAQNDLLQP